jgi:hypothetical protein
VDERAREDDTCARRHLDGLRQRRDRRLPHGSLCGDLADEGLDPRVVPEVASRDHLGPAVLCGERV